MQAHLSLYVSQLEASVAFYRAFLGTEPIKRKPQYAKFQLQDPQWVISLVENARLAHPHFGHVGIVVADTEAVHQWRTAAESRGVSIARIEEGTRCCYAKQDKFWVSDPDGIQWEVYTFHEDSEWNDPQHELQPASQTSGGQNDACCAG